MEYWVYILSCSNGTHYTGFTGNLRKRLSAHANGEVKSTKNFRPVKLVGCIGFTNRYKARAFEQYLKSGSGAAFRNKRLV